MDLNQYAFLVHLADAHMKRYRGLDDHQRPDSRYDEPTRVPIGSRVRARMSGALLRLANVIDPEPCRWPVQQA